MTQPGAETVAEVNGWSNLNGNTPTVSHRIWIVTGPAGCGKTTVAGHLARSLNWKLLEGDQFHTPENRERMRNGIPLTDVERWDWLTTLRVEAIKALGAADGGVVIACSALKRKYRDVFRVAPYYDSEVKIHFIFLDAPEDVLMQHVAGRTGHYMGASMVKSQLEALEKPYSDEVDVTTIKVVQNRQAEKVKQLALQCVRTIEEGGTWQDEPLENSIRV